MKEVKKGFLTVIRLGLDIPGTFKFLQGIILASLVESEGRPDLLQQFKPIFISFGKLHSHTLIPLILEPLLHQRDTLLEPTLKIFGHVVSGSLSTGFWTNIYCLSHMPSLDTLFILDSTKLHTLLEAVLSSISVPLNLMNEILQQHGLFNSIAPSESFFVLTLL